MMTHTKHMQSSRDRDEFIAEVLPLATKAAAIGTGVVLAFEFYRHRRLIAVASAFAGALMWTNRTLNKHSGSTPHRSYRKIAGAPSFAGESLRPATQTPVDELDEALMESFPASDPPASSRR